MTDFLNQILQTWSDRIRSPILGSIAIAFTALNWKPLYYLLFADVPVITRFGYFEASTSWTSLLIGPLLLGIALAVVSPWLSLAGAWVAQFPRQRLHSLQDLAATERRIAELDLKEREEEKYRSIVTKREVGLIEAANRGNDAEEVGGEKLRKELEEQRKHETVSEPPLVRSEVHTYGRQDEIAEGLTQGAQELLVFLKDSKSGQIQFKTTANTGYYEYFEIDGRNIATEHEGREIEKVRQAVEELDSWKLINRALGRFNITPKGEEVAKSLKLNWSQSILAKPA